MRIGKTIIYECGDEIIYADRIVFRNELYNPHTAKKGLRDPINPKRGIVLKDAVTDKPDDEIKVQRLTRIGANTYNETEEIILRKNVLTRTGRKLVLIEGELYMPDDCEDVEIFTSRGWLCF
jgi:hypothetical protein